MSRHWRELSMEDRITRLLNEVTWLIGSLGRSSKDSVLIAAKRLAYTVGEILSCLGEIEAARQAQLDLVKEEEPKGGKD